MQSVAERGVAEVEVAFAPVRVTADPRPHKSRGVQGVERTRPCDARGVEIMTPGGTNEKSPADRCGALCLMRTR